MGEMCMQVFGGTGGRVEEWEPGIPYNWKNSILHSTWVAYKPTVWTMNFPISNNTSSHLPPPLVTLLLYPLLSLIFHLEFPFNPLSFPPHVALHPYLFLWFDISLCLFFPYLILFSLLLSTSLCHLLLDPWSAPCITIWAVGRSPSSNNWTTDCSSTECLLQGTIGLDFWKTFQEVKFHKSIRIGEMHYFGAVQSKNWIDKLRTPSLKSQWQNYWKPSIPN